MRRRAVRLLVVVVLLVAGAAAGVTLWTMEVQIRAIDSTHQDLIRRIDGMMEATAAVAPEPPASFPQIEGSTDTVAGLVRRLDADLASVRGNTRAVQSDAILQALTQSVASLVEADARLRDYATDNPGFYPTSGLLAASREHLVDVQSRLQQVRAAEATAAVAERERLRRTAAAVAGGTALLWTLGLLLLAPLPRRERGAVMAPATAAGTTPEAAPGPARAAQGIDLAAAAALCTDLSRVSSTSALPDLLARAATLLNARGLIVWMGAGDELFAVVSHGYDPRMAQRLGPIRRGSTNATALAWRTGRLASVPANGGGSHAAIVAPMFNPTDCVGVLAAEVPAGHEANLTARAVTALIAAQLAAAVAAWPAGSTTPGDAPPLDHAGRAAG